MKWFLAKLVFKIKCGDGNHAAQFDEQIRLIQAGSAEEALETGRKIGKEESDAFLNTHLEMVKWEFLGVAELITLDNECHGAEVYSRIVETNFEEGYLKFFRNQSEQLHQFIHSDSN